MIRFKCPSCGLAASAPEDCVGRSTKCRGCNNPIVVPAIAAPVAQIVPSVTPCRSGSKGSRITAKVAADNGRRSPVGCALLAAIATFLVIVIINKERDYQSGIEIGGMVLSGASRQAIDKAEAQQHDDDRFASAMLIFVPLAVALVVAVLVRLASEKSGNGGN
jgi:hypothetical protein